MDSKISTKDLKSKLDKKQGVTVVETLAPERYREAHIPGALNIPPERIKELAPQLLPNKDAEIITYCTNNHWHASEYAARELAAMGYTSVAHYPEGKQGWMEAGLPVEKAAWRIAATGNLRVSSPNQFKYSAVVYRKGALPLHFRHSRQLSCQPTLALTRVVAGDRLAYIESTCANDSLLRDEVFRLMEEFERANDELRPAIPHLVGDQNAIKRLMYEVHIARKIVSENVCRVFSSDIFPLPKNQEQTIVVVSMEFLQGVSPAERLRSGPMTPVEALPLIKQMAAGLYAAHKRKVIHRDFKPGNVMLVPQSGRPHAVVTDFGLAFRSANLGTSQSLSRDSWASLNDDGKRHLLGTVAYMAPEQLQQQPATEQSDIYALGS